MTGGLVLLGLLALCPGPARAEGSDVYINLSGKAGEPPKLAMAMPPFIGEDPAKGEDTLLARNVQEIVRGDLLFSRYFNLLEEGPHFNGTNLEEIGRDWKVKGAGWLLTLKASSGAKAALTVRLTDLNGGQAVFERYYKQDAAFLRTAAHRISDDLVQALTGRAGIARTAIAFANDQTGHKEIYMMDYDGASLRALTRDNSIALLPRFSPDRKLIAFTTYKDGNPDIFAIDLLQGRTRPLSTEQGLNIAGGFSPDGTQLLMTLSRQKSPNLYVKTLADGTLTRLTQHFGADSSPTFSPDGSQAAFVSDRSGNPQVYLLDMRTERAKRLTSLNWCDSPAWSPTGEWVAFAGRANQKDKMDIFLVDVTGNQIRQLTRGEGSNENPAWSPDGRFLVFTSTRNKRSELFVMDSDGSAPHRLVEVQGRSFTPSWSK
ncbi:MAG: hypothetical protein AAB320_11100 [Elusimicrobiota bacterium]